jgi:hypothetical protein
MTTEKGTMDCLADVNGQYCLDSSNFSVGQCCDINDFTTPEACASQPTEVNTGLCARGSIIMNKLLREFLIPADTTYCPGTEIQR